MYKDSLIASILSALGKRGIKCFVAGGYARDMFFGLPLRNDIDIVCYDIEQREEIRAWIVEAFPLELDILFQHACEIPLEWQQGQTDVIKFLSGDGQKIDVVLKSSYSEVMSIVNNFDHNLSQFIMAGDVPTYLGSTDLRTLVPVRGFINESRRVEMKRKHEDLLPLIEKAYTDGRLTC